MLKDDKDDRCGQVYQLADQMGCEERLSSVVESCRFKEEAMQFPNVGNTFLEWTVKCKLVAMRAATGLLKFMKIAQI